ncbi:MAG: ABC transporter permease [Acidobacteria bacterium]|nr:ABC transporter permease [Acidobacteriota bacterium]
MTFEWFVARRYLQGGGGPRRDRFLSVITVIAVGAVAAGVTALVLALAINAGFRETFEERLLGATAHVNLTKKDASGIRDYGELAARLRGLAGVTSVSPALYETVLISSGSRARGIVLKGIEPEEAPEREKLFSRMREGKSELAAPEGGPPPLLIGHELARELGVFAGDTVLITSPQGRLTPFGLVPRYRSFRVVGVFESGFWDFDAGWAFTRLDAAQELFNLAGTVSVVELRLADVYAAEEASHAAAEAAGAGFVATPWMETHRSLFRALRLEKLVTALFIGLIVFVAGLNILILLVMLVLEKRRDIAVLLSLGARTRQIQRIFILHGVAIGALGTLVGLGLGFGVAWLGATYKEGLFPLDPQVYGIGYVPFRAHAADGLAIVAAALLISLAATLYPARRAARVIPVEVLRYE